MIKAYIRLFLSSADNVSWPSFVPSGSIQEETVHITTILGGGVAVVNTQHLKIHHNIGLNDLMWMHIILQCIFFS